VSAGNYQAYIPIIGPFQEIFHVSEPAHGHFMEIIFNFRIDPTVVPNVIYIETSLSGSYLMSALIDPGILSHEIATWAVLSQRNKMYARIVNISPLMQFYREDDMFIIITNEQNYKQVLEELTKVTSAPVTDSLHALMDEATSLKEAMIKAESGIQSGPLPPRWGR